MELYRALRKIQRGGDLFIGETPHDTGKALPLPASDLDVAADGMGRPGEAFPLFRSSLLERRFRLIPLPR